jgi:hypothetical protein
MIAQGEPRLTRRAQGAVVKQKEEEAAMRKCIVLALASAVLFACTKDDGMTFSFINMERPPEGIGLPPPPDYTPCYAGTARALDTNKDGKPDLIRVSNDSGRDTCIGSDSNHDGKIDTWDVLDDSGQIAKRAHDSNGDGRADQAWTFDPTNPGCAMIHADTDADGKPDPGSPLDVCQHLSGKASTPEQK